MSSYEKVVKLACKPKAAPPKSKYIDPIIAATYSEDGAIHDVCKALAPRFREPNAIVVFKALIVLHTMIRNGATDNVLNHLSQSDMLRLRNVGNGQWEGYTPPQNLTKYAQYLDYRIRAYRDLKHDPIRVQSENNRDMRAGDLAEDSRRDSLGSSSRKTDPSLVARRQTIVGRKLRVMTVEKGLLRETKTVQRTIDMLLQCKFYLDNLEDELTITALRILVKDLLILFQAVNEGVINLLENYFEMSHVDATTALSLYRHFCEQTEGVLEYLTVARKLENMLNVPIPNLKYAPVSLAGSLEEYLNDPNFEQNRIEYKTNKESADKKLKEERTSGRKRHDTKKAEEIPPVPKLDPAKKQEATTSTAAPTSAPQAPKQEVQKELADFFASIESDHAGASGSQQQPAPQFNPFAPVQAPMATGFSGASPFVNVGASPFINVQATGFPGAPQAPSPFVNVQPQPTGVPAWMTSSANPAQPQPTGGAFLMPNANAGLSPFARPQSAAPNFGAAGAGSLAPGGIQPLVPQATGSNPFRQSFLPTQPTGLPFVGQGPQSAGLPVTNGASLFGIAPVQTGAPQQPNNPFPSFPSAPPTAVNPAANSPFVMASTPVSTAPAAPNKVTPPFARPASTPITSNGSTAGPVVSHQTGSKNPFGRPKSPPPPPVPPVPTMGQLVTGAFGASGNAFGNASGTNGTTAPFVTGSNSPFNLGNTANNTATNGPTSSTTSNSPFPTTSLSSIASEFAFAKKPSSPSPSNTQIAINPLTGTPFTPLTSQDTATTNSTFSAFSSTLSSNPTGSTNATSFSSFLKPQPTGIGGSAIKPFKPSSSFGASLLESLPTIPQGTALSSPTSSSPPPNPTSSPAAATIIATGAHNFGAGLNSQPTGLTSFGSSFGSSFGVLGSGLGGSSGLAGGLQPQATGANPFRASTFGSPATPSFGALNSSSPQNPGVAPNPTGLGSSLFANKAGPTPSFGSNLFGSQPTGAAPTSQINPTSNSSTPFSIPGGFPGLQSQQQQQQSAPSLI
ncbi:hypothetical protein FRB90_005749 [Tulasnella sp. 427]|nr:hypothetical protein FRB90_005749 [Tulasnella sp. 427]